MEGKEKRIAGNEEGIDPGLDFIDSANAVFKEQLGERTVKTRAGKIVYVIPPIPKFTTTIRIDVVLNGRLDLSILKKEGYDNIKEIIFKEIPASSVGGSGGLKEIANIPETVEILKCAGNRLTSFSFASVSKMKELDLERNKLTDIDFSLMPNLKKINISYNEIQELREIPAGVKYLKCSHNNIRFLDLEGLSELTHLYIDNNNIVSILNVGTVAGSLKHVAYFNNPLKEIGAFESIPDLAIYDEKGAVIKWRAKENVGEQAKENVGEQKNAVEPTVAVPSPHESYDDAVNYKEAIFQYFKLKKEYEADLKKRITQIKNRTKDNRKKRQILLSSLKGKCVVCKRPVGTIFKKENNNYIAICGDVGRNPCRLNIRIFNGISYNFFDDMHYFKEYTEKGVEEIIKQKMDVLFNYLTEQKASKVFESSYKKYTEFNAGYSILFDRYKEIYENPAKKELIRLKTDKVYEILEEIEARKVEYRKNPTNREILREAVEIQEKELIPAIIALREAKYQMMKVICEEEGNDDIPICSLLQKEYRMDNFIYEVEEPKVIRFDT